MQAAAGANNMKPLPPHKWPPEQQLDMISQVLRQPRVHCLPVQVGLAQPTCASLLLRPAAQESQLATARGHCHHTHAARCLQEVRAMVAAQTTALHDEVLPLLRQHGIRILSYSELSEKGAGRWLCH